jgi:hypothetical protein
VFLGGHRRIGYRATPLIAAPGSHLTSAQQGYLTSYMQPCPAARLGDGARRVLAATTTDTEPIEIFRIGIEATARTLIQHAYIADQTPYRTPEEFARGMRESGIFGVVASSWYWELQASTFRRGMIPVSFVAGAGGMVRYPAQVVTMLRAMKAATIAQAHAVMARATTQERLTVWQAVQKYHHELDLIAKQYALLGEGEQPRCLGQVAHTIGGQRFRVQPGVAETYVETSAGTDLPHPGHDLQTLHRHHHRGA